MAIPTYRVYGPWKPALTWTAVNSDYTWTQLSERFLWQDLTVDEADAAEVEAIRIERRLSDIFARHRVAKAHVVLDNQSGNWSPLVNSAMRPNRPLSVHAETDAGSVYQLFTGVIESIALDPQLGDRKVLIEASDNAIKLKNQIDQTIKEDWEVGSLYISVADTAGIPRARILVDKIADRAPVAYLDEQRAADAFEQLKDTVASVMYPDGRGRLRVKDRNYDVDLSVVGSYNQYKRFDYAMGLDRLVNVARIVDEGRAATSISTVAWIGDTLPINSGETVEFNLTYVDPVTLDDRTPVNSTITPVDSLDYTFTATQSEDAANVSSALSVTLTPLALSAHVRIENNGPAGFLRKFQIRGIPLIKRPASETVETAGDSVLSYDVREKTIESDMFPTPSYRKNYAEWLTQNQKEPLGEVEFSLVNQFPDQISLELADVVSLVNTNAGVSSSYQITGINHVITFTKQGTVHTTNFDALLSETKNYLLLDQDPRGRLDSTNTLGF